MQQPEKLLANIIVFGYILCFKFVKGGAVKSGGDCYQWQQSNSFICESESRFLMGCTWAVNITIHPIQTLLNTENIVSQVSVK